MSGNFGRIQIENGWGFFWRFLRGKTVRRTRRGKTGQILAWSFVVILLVGLYLMINGNVDVAVVLDQFS